MMAVAMVATGAGAAPAMILSGPALDRHGGRVVGIALVLLAITAWVATLSGSPAALVATFVAVGFAAGGTDIAMNAAVSHAEEGGRPLMNLAHALFSVGAAAGGALGGLGREVGLGAPTVMGGLALLLLAVAGTNRGSSSGAHVGISTPGRSTPRITRFLVGIGALVALAFLVEGSMFSWGAIHLVDDFGASPGLAGFAVALFYAGSVAGRIGAHLRGASIPPALLVGCSGVAAAIGAAVLAWSPATAPAVAACLLLGVGTAAVAPTLYGIAGAGAGDARGASISTVALVGYSGFLVGPPLMGLVADAASLRASFAGIAVAGAALAIGGSLALRGRAPVEPADGNAPPA